MERNVDNESRLGYNANKRTSEQATFCTLHNIKNEELTKDVGLIPYGMHEFEGYDSFMATYINGDYPGLKYTPGLRIEEIPRRLGGFYKDACLWLMKNAKRIDVLNLYHTHKNTLRLAVVYKLFNPRGKLYVKLDGWPLEYVRKLLDYPIRVSRNPLVKLKNFTRYHVLFRLCRLVSTEFKENAEILSKDFHVNVRCVPNPFNSQELHDFRPFSQRSNIITSVGRVEKAKGSHVLLEAFAKIASQIPDWSLRLVGALKDETLKSDFLAKYPYLKERVIFTGPISDRSVISELYMDAKVFAFPTRYEACPLSLSEALVHGCFAVTSNIPSNRLLTENFRFALASDVDDIDGLAENLLYACTHEAETEALALEGRKATIARCDLAQVSSRIAEGLR